MHDALIEVLADPVGGNTLALAQEERDETGEIVSGRLQGGQDRSYAIAGAIPRFVLTSDPYQRQTERSFAFKWDQQHTYRSPGMLQRSQQWLVARYGFASADDLANYLAGRGCVLDAGCGSGFSASLWLTPAWAGEMWVGADISTAVDVARDRLASVSRAHFVQGDIVQPPFRAGSFDVVFAEGVLHHTPSTACAFHALVPLLKPGGELMAYVYRRKGPVREFTDDYVRASLSSLPPEEAWQALRSLTVLGRALAELRAEVEVPEDVPLLGIVAGRYDVQRLIYWHFAKLFWNTAYSFDENLHVNFDWYHPRYAHRHTEEEVRSWCVEAKLEIVHFDAQESGYTVRAVKR